MASGFDMSGLLGGLTEFQTKADAAIRAYADNSALALQNSAKENAKWQNRTGHARQRLKGDVLTVSNGYKLRLAHGVDYGIWLEFAHEKRFAILFPTIRYVGTFEIIPGFDHLLERLK